MFHYHHILPKQFADHRVVRFLSDLFNRDGVENLMALPSEQWVANDFGSSPHTGGHLQTYHNGFKGFLDRVGTSPEFGEARAGDAAARDQLSSKLKGLVAAAKYALANKHLLANTPLGMTPEDAKKINEDWFENWEDYAEKHHDEIQQMRDTVEQLHRFGQLDQAVFWPLLSPTSTLSLADKIDILRRHRDSPITQQFTTIGPIPDLPGFVPSIVDTRLPGFIPPSLDGLIQREGFMRHDPSVTYGLPGFPVSNPALQGLGPLPPSIAMPQAPQVLQFNQETGRPLTFSDGSPVFGPAPSATSTAVGRAALAGTAAAGAGMVALSVPALWPTLPLSARLAMLGIFGTTASAPAVAGDAASSAGAAGGGAFSTGTAPYNAFNTSSSASNTSTSGGNPRGSLFGPPLVESKPLEQEPDPVNTFADRFGNWIDTSAGTMPAQASPSLGGPAPGAAGAVAPEDVRRLTRVNASNSANAFASGTSPIQYLPSSEFNDRFGNWSLPPGDRQSPQASRPVGAFAHDPVYSIQPPIWGLEDPRGPQNDAEEWFSRWIRPLMRQDRMD
ncbi:hypothetical protein Q3C01_29550 [Bradyrhizobium sp. UFLA05-109]